VTQKNALLSTPLRAWSLYPDMGSEVYIFIQHCFQSFSTRFLKSFHNYIAIGDLDLTPEQTIVGSNPARV
jgi:hypothetical protein